MDRAMRPYKYKHIGDRLLARWVAGQAERDEQRQLCNETFDKARDAALSKLWSECEVCDDE